MGDWFGGGGGGYPYFAAQQDPIITPAVAKDAEISSSLSAAQQQERSLRRGIASTYKRGQMAPASEENSNGKKQTLG